MKNFKSIRTILLIAILSVSTINDLFAQKTIYKTATLEIDSIAHNTFVHRTWLSSTDWGKVSCNGAIYINNKQAVVFDTPTNDTDSRELLQWISKRAKAVAIVVNHAHLDCLGGIKAFHKMHITSYANYRTINKAKSVAAFKNLVPQHSFINDTTIKVGQSFIRLFYPGEGHTSDNIVGYILETKVLFGGCIIKTIDASKGNLEDANINTWSASVNRIKNTFPDARIIIPGHGNYGNRDLLEYTIKLFMKPE